LPNAWPGMLLSIAHALRFAGYFRAISRVTLESRKFFPEAPRVAKVCPCRQRPDSAQSYGSAGSSYTNAFRYYRGRRFL